MSDYLAPAAAVILPHLGFVAGDIFARRKDSSWHAALKTPSWSPPTKVYYFAWTTLNTSIGYASYLVWKDGGGFGNRAAAPLAWYGTQLALNWSWTPLFFQFRCAKLSFVNGVLLSGGVAGTIYAFHNINEKAAYLLLPYFAWVVFNTALSFKIWRDNPEQKKE